ncbi:MAG TPA: IPT/TIG domain-containing protein, partial [Terriglobia bacterium]|nr:IPT/TIG domain-containing protein [Terriglobia bacterium]
MPEFRSVLALPLAVAFAAFLLPVAAHGSCYKPLCCTYPPVQGTTHIESVSPQVALPGVTRVYIEGYCFGDSQGSGSIKLNGEPMTDIVFWTDAEIAFRPLLDATSGNLAVTSSSYGSDSTALEHFHVLCSVLGAKKEALAIGPGNGLKGDLGRPKQLLFCARSVAAQDLFDLA